MEKLVGHQLVESLSSTMGSLSPTIIFIFVHYFEGSKLGIQKVAAQTKCWREIVGKIICRIFLGRSKKRKRSKRKSKKRKIFFLQHQFKGAGTSPLCSSAQSWFQFITSLFWIYSKVHDSVRFLYREYNFISHLSDYLQRIW